MKINWGKGIAIAIVLFVSFIMYFVITMTTDNRYNHDLVTDNYYKNELTYQDKLNANRNALNLSSRIQYKISTKGIEIELPKELKNTELHAKVFLYRPSDKQLDFEITFSKSTNYLLVPDNRLSDGRWNISLEIRHEDKDYFVKEEIIY
jgi:nitrogen fixation protein FixH